jgi:hypothetical protein
VHQVLAVEQPHLEPIAGGTLDRADLARDAGGRLALEGLAVAGILQLDGRAGRDEVHAALVRIWRQGRGLEHVLHGRRVRRGRGLAHHDAHHGAAGRVDPEVGDVPERCAVRVEHGQCEEASARQVVGRWLRRRALERWTGDDTCTAHERRCERDQRARAATDSQSRQTRTAPSNAENGRRWAVTSGERKGQVDHRGPSAREGGRVRDQADESTAEDVPGITGMTSVDSVDRARKLRSAGGLAESLPAIPPGRTREDLERSPARRESALPTPAVEIGAPARALPEGAARRAAISS